MTAAHLASGFPIPLTSKTETFAQGFTQKQLEKMLHQEKFWKGLAIYAVEFYLRCMAIESEPGDCQHPLLSQLLDGADVVVKGLGKLECCPLLPGETTVQVPVDAWDDRLAYIVVLLEDGSQQAQILGFKPEPISEQGTISVASLRPIDEFPQYLNDCQITPLSQVLAWSQEKNKQLKFLSEVVCGSFRGWQLTEEFNLALTRNENEDYNIDKNMGKDNVSHLKKYTLLSKFILIEDLNLELIMNLSRRADNRLLVEFLLESELNTVLPETLQLRVIDSEGRVFQQLSPDLNKVDLMVQPFSAAPGERFSIELSYGEAQHAEMFIV